MTVKGELWSANKLNITTIPSDGAGSCLSMELRDMARRNIRDQVSCIIWHLVCSLALDSLLTLIQHLCNVRPIGGGAAGVHYNRARSQYYKEYW